MKTRFGVVKQLKPLRSAKLLRCIKVNNRRIVPLYHKSVDEPFFIVSAGRSGTTLLRRMLLAGKEVYIPPESYVIPDIISTVKKNPRLRWTDIVHFAMARYEYHSSFDSWRISLKPLKNALMNIPEDEQSLASIISAIHLFHGNKMGVSASRWGDKTPMYVFHGHTILEVFPKAKFVCLVRDGVDVAVSITRMGIKERDLEYGAVRWQRSVEAFDELACLYKDQCLEVRYEDLVRKPVNVLMEICQFLDIQFLSEMLEDQSIPPGEESRVHHGNLGNRINCDSVGKGRAQMGEIERAYLRRSIGRTLVEKGYELP